MWKWGQLKVVGMTNDRLGANVLAIGQDTTGELYVLTSTTGAPKGDTGKVWKIVPAAGGTSPETTAQAAAGATTEPSAGATAAPGATTAPSTGGATPATTEQASG